MDLARVVVTLLGLGLIGAVNLYFFARPGVGRIPRVPGHAGIQPGPGPADEAPGER
jgi:hypothetical protein